MALSGDGTVWSWGDNTNGQLGTGNITRVNTPIKVSGGNFEKIIGVVAGNQTSAAIREDGSVYLWGKSLTSTDKILYPAIVNGFSDISNIALGKNHMLAINLTGNLFAMGENDKGQLGQPTDSVVNTPIQISALSKVAALAAGDSFSSVIGQTSNSGVSLLSIPRAKAEGGTPDVLTSGENDSGQLGDGTTDDSNNLGPTSSSVTTTSSASGGVCEYDREMEEHVIKATEKGRLPNRTSYSDALKFFNDSFSATLNSVAIDISSMDPLDAGALQRMINEGRVTPVTPEEIAAFDKLKKLAENQAIKPLIAKILDHGKRKQELEIDGEIPGDHPWTPSPRPSKAINKKIKKIKELLKFGPVQLEIPIKRGSTGLGWGISATIVVENFNNNIEGSVKYNNCGEGTTGIANVGRYYYATGTVEATMKVKKQDGSFYDFGIAFRGNLEQTAAYVNWTIPLGKKHVIESGPKYDQQGGT
jgi:hypothetical protein